MSEVLCPEEWKACDLGDVATITSGVGFPKRFQGKVSGDYPVYKVGDISKAVLEQDGKLRTSNNYVSITEAEELKGKVLPEGATVFAKIGEAVKLNRRAILIREGLADNNVMCVKSVESEMDRFIYHFLCTVSLNDVSRSTTVPSVRKGDVEGLRLNLPSLAEQKEIAARLDNLLAQVESIKTRLDAIPAILKRFRQSILAAAVSGKLTEQSRGTPATPFYQSPVTIGKETENAPDHWRWSPLTDLAVLESGHTPRKSVPEYWEGGDVYWISLQDIRSAHGSIIKDTKHKPTMQGIDNSSARLLPEGTVCFSRDISVGFTTIMGHEMSTTQHFANWICGEKLNNKYLMYALMAAKEHLTVSGQGTTVKTIYMPALKQFHILLPPINEQKVIVGKVEKLLMISDQIELLLDDARAKTNNLTQSILAKAFRGELTADWREQHPDLISAENSAQALLEKIKTQQAKLAKTSRKKRTKKS